MQAFFIVVGLIKAFLASWIDVEVIAKSEEASLTNAVIDLPMKYREAVVLFYYEELSVSNAQQ